MNLNLKILIIAFFAQSLIFSSEVKSIDIVLREYNILVIPRHWLFKIDNSSIDIYTADNIFTN